MKVIVGYNENLIFRFTFRNTNTSVADVEVGDVGAAGDADVGVADVGVQMVAALKSGIKYHL